MCFPHGIIVAFTAVLHREDGMYVAFCPEVGTTSQGKTVEEAVGNLREATTLYLEEFPVKSVDTPIVTVFEVKHARSAKTFGA